MQCFLISTHFPNHTVHARPFCRCHVSLPTGLALYYLEAKALLARLVRDYDVIFTGDLGAVTWREFPVRIPAKNNLFVRVTHREAAAV